jgi:uncharacterized protein with PIN domain
MQTALSSQKAITPAPRCDDCRMPLVFKAEVADFGRGRQVRVYQCLNCAKVIWWD